MNEARGNNEWRETYGSGFGSQVKESRLIKVPIDQLDPWQDENGNRQPFRMYSDAQLQELADNIRHHGIITPLRVRPVGKGRYQILAGHNRCAAAKLVGLRTVPALVEAVDDARAAEILVDSNLQQRQELLPSEKAFAYKLKLDAIKQQLSQNETKQSGLRSDALLAEDVSDSRAQIQRYIRLTYLIPEFLQMVDDNRLALLAGVDLSFLPTDTQRVLLHLMQKESLKVTPDKAKLLHNEMPTTEDEMRGLLVPPPKTPAFAFKLTLPQLTKAEYKKLSKNAKFQEELLLAVSTLVGKYLK